MNWIDEWLFPRRCPVCREIAAPRGGWICDSCRDKLKRIVQPRCFRCGRQLSHTEEEYCSNCLRQTGSIRRGIAGFDYTSIPVRQMVSEVKYHNHRQLLDYPCRCMAQEYHALVKEWAIECLVPVPLHRSRQRKRGFNQAAEIAKRLARTWELPVEHELLIRVKKTQPQKELDAAARAQNLANAFTVRETAAVNYTAVGIVDDIYTTGSTMEACAKALRAAGIERVYSIALSVGSG